MGGFQSKESCQMSEIFTVSEFSLGRIIHRGNPSHVANKFHSNSFLLTNTQKKLLWPSLRHVIRRAECFKVDSHLSVTCQFRISTVCSVSDIETLSDVF
jgi:hypothetical protein